MLTTSVVRAGSALLLAFIALLVLVPDAHRVVALAGLGLSALIAVIARGEQYARLDRDDAWFCAALLLYGGVWCLDVWRSGYWPLIERAGFRALPLWPLLAVPVLIGLRCYPPNPRMLWWGACLGACGAGLIALYERLVLGAERASNGINAIPFGNLSLLLGSLSLLAVLWCLRRHPLRQVPLWGLALLAATLGLLGSVLSGTRGGWIALPFLMLLAYRAAREVLPQRYLRRMAAGLAGLLLVAALLPQSGIGDRLVQVSEDAQRYWQQGRAGSSLGMRLELWRAGAIMVGEQPLFGLGERHTEGALRALADEGRVYDRVIIHIQLHNEFIDTAARRGAVGVLSLIVLYAVPLWLFWKRLRRFRGAADIQILAAAGMMVVVAFFSFGLTQSMLRDLRGLSGYLGLCVACWVALRAREEARKAVQLSSSGLHPGANIEDDEGRVFAQHSRSRP